MAATEKASRMWARWPMDYGARPEVTLDPGQVFVLQGMPNDEKLVRLGYCAPLDKTATIYACAECGAEFVGVSERTQHGRRRHRDAPSADARSYRPGDEDTAVPVYGGNDADLEAEERRLIETAPLYTDNAAAARA